MAPVVIERVERGFLDLSLRSVFRTHWKTIHAHRTLLFRVQADGVWGEGEAYTLDPGATLRSFEPDSLLGRNAWEVEALLAGIPDPAARSALDLALHDLLGRTVGVPVRDLLGVPFAERTTCASIGVADRAEMLAAARGWIERGHRIIKVKLARSVDPGLIHDIRGIGGEGLRIWVDANQAYDPDSAVRVAEEIAPAGVEIFEQPLPIGMIDAYASIRPRMGIPVILDEEVKGARDVARAAMAGGIDGVNVKLAKMGGLRESIRAVHAARAHGMQVLLGCFFESSLGIAGAAQILGLADHVDLDAPLHVDNDPYAGLEYVGGRILPLDGPGLGVVRRATCTGS